MDKDKVRENRLRRIAERRGFAIEKSRRRDPRAYDFDRWLIRDLFNGAVVAGDRDHYSLTLDEVEAWLNRPQEGTQR